MWLKEKGSYCLWGRANRRAVSTRHTAPAERRTTTLARQESVSPRQVKRTPMYSSNDGAPAPPWGPRLPESSGSSSVRRSSTTPWEMGKQVTRYRTPSGRVPMGR